MIKGILMILFILFLQDSQKFSVEINATLTEKSLNQLIAEAKRNGLTIDVLYASYNQDGTLKSAQFKASLPNVGEGQGSFSSASNKCLIIYKDLTSNSKSAFGFKNCLKD